MKIPGHRRPCRDSMNRRIQSRQHRRSRPSRIVWIAVAALVVLMAAAGSASAAAAGWSIQSVPVPTHVGDTVFEGVSCLSRTDCVVVGGFGVASSDVSVPLVERWNGSRWSREPTPIPSVREWGGSLADVSCPSRVSCFAVGTFSTSFIGERPMAERWDGRHWRIQRTHALEDAYEFNGVSCASTTSCIAVGNGQESLAERWNGKALVSAEHPLQRSVGKGQRVERRFLCLAHTLLCRGRRRHRPVQRSRHARLHSRGTGLVDARAMVAAAASEHFLLPQRVR